MTLISKEERCYWCGNIHIDAINEESWCEAKKFGIKEHHKKMESLGLTDADKAALRLAKIEVKEYWAVVLQPNGVPVAMFDSKGHAELWKHDNWRTAFIELYNLQLK